MAKDVALAGGKRGVSGRGRGEGGGGVTYELKLRMVRQALYMEAALLSNLIVVRLYGNGACDRCREYVSRSRLCVSMFHSRYRSESKAFIQIGFRWVGMLLANNGVVCMYRVVYVQGSSVSSRQRRPYHTDTIRFYT